MGKNYTDTIKYECSYDCELYGCPGHLMRLVSCRSTDIIHVEIDGEPVHWFNDGSFSALKTLMEGKIKWN